MHRGPRQGPRRRPAPRDRERGAGAVDHRGQAGHARPDRAVPPERTTVSWINGHDVQPGDTISTWEDAPAEQHVKVKGVHPYSGQARDAHKGIISGENGEVVIFAGQVFRHSEATKDVSQDGPE